MLGNEPAFPRPISATVAPLELETAPAQDGITWRDYLIAHAPAEPQPWFEPTMPPRPKYPDVPDLPDEVRGPFMNWLNDPHWDLDVDCMVRKCGHGGARAEQLVASINAFIDARQRAINDIETWSTRRRRELFVQWPIAWADAVLAAMECEPVTGLDPGRD